MFPGPASDGGFLTRDLPQLLALQGNERIVVDTLLGGGLGPSQAWFPIASFTGALGATVSTQVDYQMLITDGLVRVDGSLGPRVITLPALASGPFMIQRVKRIDTVMANQCTIKTPDGAKIDGLLSQRLQVPNGTFAFRPNVLGGWWDMV